MDVSATIVGIYAGLHVIFGPLYAIPMAYSNPAESPMTSSDLVTRLSQGWLSEKPALIEDLIRSWWQRTQAAPASVEVHKDFAFFTQVIDSVKLRNFHDLQVLMVGGAEPHPKELAAWLQR